MTQRLKTFMKKHAKTTLLMTLATAGICATMHGMAAGGTDQTLSAVAGTLSKTVATVGKILTNVALISGVGFICVSFFKLHAHKNNPTQVPLSHGISMLVIGGGLTVFPFLIHGVAKAGFGTSTAHSGGAAIKTLLSTGTSADS